MEPTRYRIVVRGELSERFRSAFDGMELRSSSGTTVLTGDVLDQSHLQGLLERAAQLGLELVSVEPIEPAGTPYAEVTTVSDARAESADRDQGGDGGAGR